MRSATADCMGGKARNHMVRDLAGCAELNGCLCRSRLPGQRLARQYAAVELVDHARHLGLCLVVGRNAMVSIHGQRTGIVGGQRQG